MDALKSASEHDVRAILMALCDDSDVRTKALNYLADLAELQKITFTRPGKRKASSTLSICVQCEEAFDEADNTAKVCQYHNGELDPDYDSDFWAFYDERFHGVIDSDFCRKEYPEGFLWTCCDEIGTHPGCKFSRHQSDPDKSKRLRDDDSSSESSELSQEDESDLEASDEDDDDDGESEE